MKTVEPVQLAARLDDPAAVEAWLRGIGLRDLARGATNVRNLAATRLPADLLAGMLGQLEEGLRAASDRDMALNCFERFFLAARSRLGLAALIDRDRSVIPVLLRIFSTSHYLGELLIRDQEAFDALRMTEGQPQTRRTLCGDIGNVLDQVVDPKIAMRTLRRFKQREVLRIAYGDLVLNHRLGMVTEQISFLAEALCEGALQFCDRQLRNKWGTPRDEDGAEVPFAILALGKLGGRELNYSSDIDLVMVFGTPGQCDGGRGRSCQEYFDELTREFTRLMSETTPDGFAWRVDLRLRPEGQKGRLCNHSAGFLRYYEQKGRAWERQALIKCRAVAGDRKFGQQIIDELQPWIWRRFSHFDISSVKSLKRQIERRAVVSGVESRDVKTGRGGIRDIEFTTQFLQLLHGAALPEVRHHNTLAALERLQRAGCLSFDEETRLMQNYIWLRKLEHRLQLLADLQTHRLPESDDELARVALRMGYVEVLGQPPLKRFRADYDDITATNRGILDHLLHGAFGDRDEGDVPEVVDLIDAVEVEPERAAAALRPWGFSDPVDAARRIQGLASEGTPFLPAGRCRHFLAAVLPRLLGEIANAPDPDRTLGNLLAISDQIGGKGVLWELFHTQPAAMKLFVRLCSTAGYLGGILRSNPGMIDELVDALLVSQLPSRQWLEASLAELRAGSQDPLPIIHSFKQAQHLRIGMLDLVGRGEPEEVTRALSDVADVCLASLATFAWRQVCDHHGRPQFVDPAGKSRDGGVAIVACGKLGGRELNWQSDLDLLFLFESDGQTAHPDPARQTTSQHACSQWASEVTRLLSARSTGGRLYEVDSRLRPTGKSGSLATSAPALLRYFSDGQGQTWERLALCRARVVWQTGPAGWADEAVLAALASQPWSNTMVDDARAMRQRLEQNASPEDLKRGPGGAVDVEFVAELLQLKMLASDQRFRTPSILEILGLAGGRERADGALHAPYLRLAAGFRFLRRVESCLRLCEETPRHSLAGDSGLARKVALLMGLPSGGDLQERLNACFEEVRGAFEEATVGLREEVGQKDPGQKENEWKGKN